MASSIATAPPRTRPFLQIDVFSSEPSYGNPVAVVVDAEGLTTEQMQVFAAWTNLSETTFLLPPTHPDADYRVRIFTRNTELPFAGHPTLGSARAWLSQPGHAPRGAHIVQECGIGLVRVRQDVSSGTLAFSAPPLLRSGEVSETLLQRTCEIFALERSEVRSAQWVDNGPGWYVLLLRSAERVLSLGYERVHELRGIEKGSVGFVGPYKRGESLLRQKGLLPPNDATAAETERHSERPHFEVRAFDDSPEDPVTGSLNAGIAQWLIGAGLAPPSYTATQGGAMTVKGRITVSSEAGEASDGDVIWVGGETVLTIQGEVLL